MKQSIYDDFYLRGIKFAFVTAIISGLAVFVNKFGVGLWESSSVYTTAKNIAAALFLTGLLVMFKKLPEIRKLSKKQLITLVLIGFVGGSVPFLLFFKSLAMIPAPQAAFVHKTLFLWVALFSFPFLKERLSRIQLLALGILFIGVFLFGAPKEWVFGTGFILALIATILWAVENIIAKLALKHLSSIVVGWARMFIGSIFLLIFLAITGNISGIIPTSLNQLGMALLVGFVLFGYVISWYSALKYAPATIVSSVLVIAAPITLVLNAIFVTHAFPAKLTVPIVVMLLAILLVSKQFGYFYTKFKRRNSRAYFRS